MNYAKVSVFSLLYENHDPRAKLDIRRQNIQGGKELVYKGFKSFF
jgi:hypothetical protein